MSQENIPPPRGFDEFQTLSSTKQNIELFKILSAIAEELEERNHYLYNDMRKAESGVYSLERRCAELERERES